MKRLIDITALKFLLVGVVNTLVGAGIMFVLYNFAGLSYWFSSAANYVVGGVVSFFLNKYFTFKNKGWSWHQVWRFILNLMICYILAYSIAQPLVGVILSGAGQKLRDNIAMLAGMGLYTVFNYFGQRFFAFK